MTEKIASNQDKPMMNIELLIIVAQDEGILECRIGDEFGDVAWHPSDELIEAIRKELKTHSKPPVEGSGEYGIPPFRELSCGVQNTLEAFEKATEWTKEFEKALREEQKV